MIWSRLCSCGWRGLAYCGGGPIGKDVGLFSFRFLCSTWAQSLWLRADRQGRWSAIASVPLVSVSSVTVVAGRTARALIRSGLCTFGWRGLIYCGGGPIDKCVGLVSPLFVWSAWAPSQRSLAYRQGRWYILASVPLVVVISVTVVAYLLKGVGLVWPLFLLSAWAPSLWWLAEMQGRCFGIALVPLFGVSSITEVAG
jgi:hypothetical protein